MVYEAAAGAPALAAPHAKSPDAGLLGFAVKMDPEASAQMAMAPAMASSQFATAQMEALAAYCAGGSSYPVPGSAGSALGHAYGPASPSAGERKPNDPNSRRSGGGGSGQRRGTPSHAQKHKDSLEPFPGAKDSLPVEHRATTAAPTESHNRVTIYK